MNDFLHRYSSYTLPPTMGIKYYLELLVNKSYLGIEISLFHINMQSLN